MDGAPGALLSLMPMRGESSLPDNATDALSRSQSGMTLEHSMESRGKDTSTLSAAGSHVRTLARLVKEQESPASEADCGKSLPASLARWALDSSSWKTHQRSLDGDWEPFSETWPRWGMMQNGECWALTTPAHLTAETGYGLWPTIRSSDGERGGRGDLIQAVRGNENSHYKMWPTPCALEVEKDLENWKAKRNLPRSQKGGSHGPNLATAVRLYPTATARDWRTGDKPESRRARMKAIGEWHSPNLNDVAAPGGHLNPNWVEWLMGWPIGWTASEPLAMDKFQQWLDSHGRR